MSKTEASQTDVLAGDLRIAAGRLLRRLRSRRGKAELPEHLFVVLTALNKYGTMTPSALADLEGVRPPSMTRSVNALLELGFVTKESNTTDKRQVTVRLTDQGRLEIKETRRVRDIWLADRLGTLTPQERDVLAQASKLLKRIAEQ